MVEMPTCMLLLYIKRLTHYMLRKFFFKLLSLFFSVLLLLRRLLIACLSVCLPVRLLLLSPSLSDLSLYLLFLFLLYVIFYLPLVTVTLLT